MFIFVNECFHGYQKSCEEDVFHLCILTLQMHWLDLRFCPVFSGDPELSFFLKNYLIICLLYSYADEHLKLPHDNWHCPHFLFSDK